MSTPNPKRRRHLEVLWRFVHLQEGALDSTVPDPSPCLRPQPTEVLDSPQKIHLIPPLHSQFLHPGLSLVTLSRLLVSGVLPKVSWLTF